MRALTPSTDVIPALRFAAAAMTALATICRGLSPGAAGTRSSQSRFPGPSRKSCSVYGAAGYRVADMSELSVRLEGPPQTGWRFAHFALAISAFELAVVAPGRGVSLWLVLSPAAVAVCLAAIAALLDDTET